MANIAKIKRLSIDNIAKIYKINKNSIAKVMGVDLAAPNTRDVYIDYHNIDSDLTNFPLLINLSNSSGKDNYDITEIFDTIGSDYSKLKVYDSNGTQLYTEVENWDAANKTAQLWVKVPHISSSVYTHLILDYNSDSGSNDYISDNPAAKPVNLNVDLGSQGTYDSSWSEECSIIKESDTSYKMWYSGWDGTNPSSPTHYRIIYCTSTDGINWSNHQMVVDLGSQGTYDTTRAYRPRVIKDGNTYKMWYTGSDESHFRILYCTSTDGINWSNFQLVMNYNTEGTYDTTDVTDSYVIKDGSTYKMWYTGYSDHWRIMYCDSTDGINWDHFQMVVNYNQEGTYDTTRAMAPSVIKESDTSYKMWYTGKDATHNRIMYCTSTDGINWSNFQMVVDISSEGTYDTKHSRYPVVIKESDNLYKMWYDGKDYSSNVRILYATSEDGKVWTKNIANRVWNDDFVGVWHMSQSPSGGAGCIYDSTSNINHGTPNGSMTNSDLVDGKIGKAINFDGSDDYINIGKSSSISNMDGINTTLNFIVNTSYTAAREDIVGTLNSGATDEAYIISMNADGDGVYNSKYTSFYLRDQNGKKFSGYITTDIYDNNPHNIALVISTNNSAKMYVDGVDISITYDNNGLPTSFSSFDYDLLLGAVNLRGTQDNYYKGIIDEVKLSKTARSLDWVKATYHSNWDNLIAYDKEVYTLEIDNSNIDSNLTNFPLLVNLSNSAGVNNYDLTKIFDTIGSDYTKLRIYDSNGQQLYTEVENWDAANKTAQLWVKVPVVSGTSTTKLTLDYGATYGNVDYISDNPVAKAINMVVDVGSEGTYDTNSIQSPCIIKESNTSYKMWYTGYDGTSYRILYCNSTDGINWSNHQMVVDLSSQGSYDNNRVSEPWVIKDGSTYKMWYAGNNVRIIYCDSTDGINWSNFQISVNKGAQGTYDTSKAYYPCVIKDGSTYKMWYSGHDGSRNRIIYCTSTDGTSWSNFQMVVNYNQEGTYDYKHVFSPCVTKESSGSYKMWYTGQDNSSGFRVMYATSTNGTSWSNYEMVLDFNKEGTYDTNSIYYPYVSKEDSNLYKMWYSGHDGTNSRILYATSEDGKVWTKNVVNRVWDDDFVGIWHMNQNPTSSGTIYDSTLNAIHGISSDNMDSNNLVDGKIGKALEFDGANHYVDLGNPTSLQITGDQTISMWLKPASLNTSRNPYAKAYGGEGTITQFEDGTVKYYYGTAGTNGTPYQEFSMIDALVVGEWSHLAIVRDLTNMKLRWYKNGVLTNQADALYAQATASTLHAYIGKGYVPNCYDGVIDDLRVYDRALKESEVAQLAGIDLTNGLVGYWKFDEGSGTTAVDSSGHSGDGTLLNGPTWVDGVNDKALSFDGTDDYVLINSPSSHVNDNIITITSWFKGLGGIVGTGKYFVKTGTNEIIVWYDVSHDDRHFSVTYDSTKWHFVTVELDYNNNTIKVWLDGNYVGEQSHSGTSLTVSDLRIGNFNQTMHLFNGTIDDVRIYNRTLTAAEIAKLAKTTGLNYALAGYWKFDEGTGTTASDSSGNGNDGTLVNNPTWVDGVSGKALSFDGVNQHVTIGNSAELSDYSNGVTFSVWIYPIALSNGGLLVQDGNGKYIDLKLDNYGTYCNARWQTQGGNQLWSSEKIYINNWYHLAGVYDVATGTAYLYVNGVGTSKVMPINSDMSGVDIEVGHIGSYYFNGIIDDVRIYNRSLSAEEVSQLADLGLNNGLVGYWKFDEGSGTTTSDSSGFGNDGTLVNGPTWVDGISGKALSFDGVDDYVKTVNTANLSGSEITISAWFKGSAAYSIVRQQDATNFIGLGWSNMYHILSNDGGTSGGLSDGGLVDGLWHHAVMTWKQNTTNGFKTYKDGVLVAQRDSSNVPLPNINDSIYVGSAMGVQAFTSGIIDDVRIYNRSLSAEEVSQLADLDLTSGLVGYWKFDEGTGTTATDSSGSGNDMTIYGATTWTTGVSGGALSFGAASADYAGLASPSGLSSQYVSVACWVYVNAMEDYNDLVTHNWVNEGAWALFTSATKVFFGVAHNSIQYLSPYVTDISGGWHHVAGVYDGSYVRLYLDGTAVGTPTALPGQVLDTTNDIKISSDAFGKKVDEVRIYNRALSAAEVSQLADLGLNNGLVGYWKFDEGTGTTASDSSGNGNTLSIYGIVSWITGVYGKALDFGATTSDYAEVTSPTGLSSKYVSVSCWVNVNAMENNNNIVEHHWMNEGGWVLYTTTSSVQFDVYDGTTQHQCIYNTDISGNWYHLVGVYDGSYVRLYVNGQAVGTPSSLLGQILNTTDYIKVSKDEHAKTVDDLRIYNRALTSRDVKALYNGLIGHWKFDEGSGTTTSDSSGFGNDGTLVNGPTWVDGISGKALSFDGVDDYVEVPNSSSLNPSTITVAYWAKSTTTGWSDYGCHVSKRDAYIMHPLLGMTRMRFYIYDGAWYSAYYDIPDITIWHHYVGTYDGNTIKLYVDGNLSASAPHVGSINTLDTGSIFIGKDDGNEQYYNGLIDDIRIYNHALSAEEVSQLATLDLTSGLVGYWKFDEGTGTTASDSSGNGNDGTLVNNPTWVDGVSGKALSFDGVDDYVDITDDSILSGFTDFTISVWLYPQSTTNDYQALIAKNQNTGTRAYEIYFRNTGQITTYLNGNDIILNSVNSLSLNTWYNYTITRDGSNITVYINGNVDYSTDQYGVQLATNTTPLRIGYNGVSLSAFDGAIDEVRVYNRALSAAEVSQLADLGLNNGLVGYWKFDEGSGTTVSDSSGNGNNGTFINNPTWVDGVKGKALSFNGVGDYIKTASQVDLSGSELTITAFFKGSLPQSIVRQQSSGYIVFDWWGKDILSNDGGISGGVSTGNLVDGSWHYVAMTWKQNTTNGFNAYKDGQVVDQKNSSNTPIPNLNDSIYFGSYGGNSEFVVGTIDEIRISKISRSADWIKATYYSNTDRLNYWNN